MAYDWPTQHTPLSPAEASAYLQARWGLKRGTRTLLVYRRNGGKRGKRGPQFFRIGNDVRYTRESLDAWAVRAMGEPLTSSAEHSARALMGAAKEG
jgi:hypothetical protein